MKICNACGEELPFGAYDKNKNGMHLLKFCRTCVSSGNLPTCLWCGTELKKAKSTYCSGKCHHAATRRLALTGHINPDEIRTCGICKKEYGYFKILGNTKTCGGECSYKNKGRKAKEKIQKRKNGRPGECLTSPQCRHYNECLFVDFKHHKKSGGGCYTPPLEKVSVNHGTMQCMVNF